MRLWNDHSTNRKTNTMSRLTTSLDSIFDAEHPWPNTRLDGPRWGGRKEASVAVLYENGEWMEELFEALGRRGLLYEGIDLADGAIRLENPPDHPLVINRVSPSAYLRGHGAAIPLAAGWLETLERTGTRVVNGARPFRLETSKVAQQLLIQRLGLKTPGTVVFNDRSAVLERARDFPFPAILKPNMGGSGAYVRYVESLHHLEHLLRTEDDLFGPDQLLLLQEYLASADGTIVRTEFVDGELLFAMRVRSTNTFNLCPADRCERPLAAKPGAVLDDQFGSLVLVDFIPE